MLSYGGQNDFQAQNLILEKHETKKSFQHDTGRVKANEQWCKILNIQTRIFETNKQQTGCDLVCH